MIAAWFLTLPLLVASIPTQRADAPLTVSITAPASVESLDNLAVTASVTNGGGEVVKVLKYNSLLDTSPTSSFAVSKDGKAAEFTGIRVNLATESLNDAAFITIAPGQTVTAIHAVSTLYDFETLGTGSFEFASAPTLNVATSTSGQLDTVTVEPAKTTVDIQGNIAKRSSSGVELKKRARTTCSNASQSSFVTASYTEGKSLATIARNYIDANGRDALFIKYFGSSPVTRPRQVLNNVAIEASTSRTLSCTDPFSVCDGNVIAYLYQIPTIYVFSDNLMRPGLQ